MTIKLTKKFITDNLMPHLSSTNLERKPITEQLYKERFSVEQTNAWLDGFKALIIRYEVLAVTWLSLHFLAFSIILLRNVKN